MERDPLELARKDWENEMARRLVIGLLARDEPLYDSESGLYCASLGCVSTDETEKYCAAYNAEVDRLIARHGLPPWAPARRIPSRREAIEVLVGSPPASTALDQLHLDNPRRAALNDMFRSLEERRDTHRWRPAVAALIDARALLIVGGDNGTRAGLITVFDMGFGRWMETFHLRRRHAPAFPWDRVREAEMKRAAQQDDED